MTEPVIVYDHVRIRDNGYRNLRRNVNFRFPNFIVTSAYLQSHKNVYFVYGDNSVHRGKAGAAMLRDEPNAIGFITKRYPNNHPDSFYTIEEYWEVFNKERAHICNMMSTMPHKFFLFSKLGGNLANKYCIFEHILQPWLLSLKDEFPNCALLF